MSTTANLCFCDSFDHYSQAQLNSKWSSSFQASLVAGRNGNGVRLTGGISNGNISRIMSFSGLPTLNNSWMIGFAYQWNGNGATIFTTIYVPTSTANGGYTPFSFGLWPDSTLGIKEGSGNAKALFLDSANQPTVILPNVFYSIELIYTITGAMGSPVVVNCYLQVNGQNRGSISMTTSITTPVTGVDVDTHTWVAPQNFFGACILDDLYIATPATTSAFYGDVKILDYFPNADDASNQWAGNHADIDSNPANDGLSISSTTAGQKSMFGFQQITGSASYLAGLTIEAVCSFARIDFLDGSEQVKALAGTFASPVAGRSMIEADSTILGFFFDPQPWDQNPVGGGFPWTYGAFNTNEYGVLEFTT